MKQRAIRLVFVEDNEDDAALMTAELRRAQWEVLDAVRVETESEFLEAIAEMPDAIVCDFKLPQFDGLKALDLRNALAADIPMVMVSGTVGEEVAASAVLHGADDYLLKDRLTRLPMALESAIDRRREQRLRRLAEEAVQQSERLYRTIVETSRDGIVIAGGDGRMSFVNQRMADLLGYSRAQMVGRSPLDFVDGAARVQLQVMFGGPRRDVADTYELPLRHHDGRDVWVVVSSSPLISDSGERVGTLSMVSDQTDRRRAAEQLYFQALHDHLTGLSNRTLFADRLSQLIGSLPAGGTLPVLFIDVDGIGRLNDSLGYRAGDTVLVEVASRLQGALDRGDILARVGGTEFVAAVCGSDPPMEVASRLAQAVGGAVDAFGTEVAVRAHIGVATAATGDDQQEVLRQASAAMHIAKRDDVPARVFQPRSDERLTRRVSLEADLRRAITEGQLVLHFQPRVDLRDRRVVGFEALVRWHHPQRGLVPPGDFIPLAEETGLIVPLGTWVLEHACVQTAKWMVGLPETAEFAVSVNVSGRQLQREGFAAVVAEVAKDAGLPLHRIELEITESALMSDLSAAARTLADLKDLGVRIVVDDFGTGYSSLSYLKRFPVDVLKVDKSFVQGLGVDSSDTAITAAVIAMADSLGLDAVAEGVETQAQADELRLLGCEFVQGYFFGRPQPAEDLEDVVAGIRIARGGAPVLSVVVIDDDPSIRRLYREVLETHGAAVREAASGALGVALADKWQPQLIVLDLRLPDEDSMAILAELQRRAPGAYVVIASAYVDDEVTEALERGGASGVFDKTLFLAELPRLISQHPRRHRVAGRLNPYRR